MFFYNFISLSNRYYYSFIRFADHFSSCQRMMILGAPILAHGIYDTLLSVTEVDPRISSLMVVVFLIYCNRIWRYGRERILEHLAKDIHFRNRTKGL